MIRRTSLAATAALLFLTPAIHAQEWTDTQVVAHAVLAGPAELQAEAEVYARDASGALRLVRAGTNNLICLGDQPGDEQFAVSCYHRSLEPFMARGRELRDEGVEGMARNEKRWEEADAGLLIMPRVPAMVFNLNAPLDGYDPATNTVQNAGRLHAIYMPYTTPETTGLPIAPSGPGVPWLMFPGTPSSHVMISIPVQSGG